MLGAIEKVLAAGPQQAPLTRDIGGHGSTADLGGPSPRRSEIPGSAARGLLAQVDAG